MNDKFNEKSKIMKKILKKIIKILKANDQVFMIIMAICIGVLGAFGAIVFRYMIKIAHLIFFQTDSYTLEWVKEFPFWQKMLLPIIGGLIVGPFIYRFAKEVSGSGIPEVIEATALHGGAIRKRVIFTKLFAAAITIGSGGSAGREGPIVQIGSSIGSALSQFFRVSGRQMRSFTACGAAAGIAATFNAPIAGALFSIEVILGDLTVSQFSPIVIASVTATVISRHFLGDFPAFVTPEYEIVSPLEYFNYSILGIVAGLIAVLFIKSMIFSQDTFSKIPIPQYVKPALGGLIVGIIAIFLPQVYGVGYETTNNALWGRNIDLILFLIIFAKIIATSATIGSGGSGGIFAPSLVIGASLGALLGSGLNVINPDFTASAGAYALVGMGAVVSGVTHAPISSILIIFELTNDYQVLPALMISCILSILISSWLQKESMYTIKLVKKGINIHRGKDVNLLKKVSVRDVYTPNVASVLASDSFEQVVDAVEKNPTSEVFVVNDNQELLGIVSFIKIRQALIKGEVCTGEECALNFANTDITPLYLDDNLDLAIKQFGRINEDELPVVLSKANRTLIGSVRLRDVIQTYNQEVHRWDLTGGTHSILTAVTRDRHLRLTEDVWIAELELPTGFLGKTLKELDVRDNYNIHILLVNRTISEDKSFPDRPDITLPSADYVFSPGDKILVIGNKEDIQSLQEG